MYKNLIREASRGNGDRNDYILRGMNSKDIFIQIHPTSLPENELLDSIKTQIHEDYLSIPHHILPEYEDALS